jgi:hypothetical protein
MPAVDRRPCAPLPGLTQSNEPGEALAWLTAAAARIAAPPADPAEDSGRLAACFDRDDVEALVVTAVELHANVEPVDPCEDQLEVLNRAGADLLRHSCGSLSSPACSEQHKRLCKSIDFVLGLTPSEHAARSWGEELMTITATAASSTGILPNEGLVHTAGEVVIRVFHTPQAGILVQARRDGHMVPQWCSRHDFDSAALRRYAELVAVVGDAA